VPRIIVAECKQEVSSFNPVASHYDDFAIGFGHDIFAYHRQVRDELGGALSVFDAASNVDLIPTFSARAITSGGTLAAADFERLAGEFLSSLQGAGPVDAAYFVLHGAMSAEGEDDPEGYLLEQSRKILGEEIPLVISLDLHGILTDRMLTHAGAVVVYHTYPHVDFFETGARAARLLLKILNDGARPVTARVKIPALVRGDELITATGSFGECIRAAQQIEATSPGLSAGMFIGNPFTDVPDLRSNSIVVTDGDAQTAAKLAIELARTFWGHHEKMRVPLVSLPESMRLAREATGTVVMMDAADATSSGAAGDSNAILRQLVESAYERQALIPIVDSPAVDRAFRAGVGATIRTAIGGALDPARFRPLELEARVRMLSDGRFRSESFGQHWNSGDTAVLQAGNITLVVASRPVSLYDRAFYLAHGQDPRHFDLVVVKSPHCEPHMYADWCGRSINVDAPGSTSANLRSLGHTKCARPIFPLDEGVTFSPQADIFKRAR
jgi:microcystin degradation protein MlrC